MSDKNVKVCKVCIDNFLIDFDELRTQKMVLINLMDEQYQQDEIHNAKCLEGILGLIDYIQDEASLQIGEKVVFGRAE